MASSPLRAAAGQQPSRLLDMQKKFQQRHLASMAAVKGAAGTASTAAFTTPPVDAVAGVGHPVPPARKYGASPQQPQRRAAVADTGAKPAAPAAASVASDDGASMVQVDVKGKQQQRSTGRINCKTAVIAKKPLAALNGNGAKRPTVNGGGGGGGGYGGGGGHGDNVSMVGKTPGPPNRLLLPPVVQSTVINASAGAAGTQSPLARAGKLPPAQRPAALPRRKAPAPAPATPSSLASPSPRASPSRRAPPKRPAAKRASPVAAAGRPQPAKPQLSADRAPPAKGMARCPLCARDFAADRLPKHEEVCRRTRERDRKRKVFDVSKKRLEAVAAEAGVDVASFKKKSEKEDQRATEKLQKKKDAWRRKHEALVRNVQAARAVQRHLAAGGSIRDLPPELENTGPDMDDEADSDLVKCPHCNRTFNEVSAERHIPLCADRQKNAAARMQNKKR